MNKLLSANFARLWKSKEFWVSFLFMVLFSGWRTCGLATQPEPENRLDNGFFFYTILIGIIMAAFVSLFVGIEYHDGTIRNKLIIGHKRGHIYLSYVIVSTVAGLLFCLSYIAVGLLIGSFLLDGFQVETVNVIATALCSLLMTASYTAIFVLIVMLNQNRAVTAVISLILAFTLLIVGIEILAELEQPERVPGYTVVEDGEVIFEGTMENPRYLAGMKRSVYEFLCDFLPGGQSVQLSSMMKGIINPPVRMYVYDLLIILLTSGCGLFLFHRKDLK